MLLKRTPLFIILLMALCSCVSYQKYPMEVYKPGERNFPSDVKKVVLVARNLKYKTDTLQNYQSKEFRLVKDKTVINVDSLVITSCFDSLSARLLDRSRFDSVLILPYNTNPRLRVTEVRPEKSGWYKNLAAQSGADAIISLDMYSCFYSHSVTQGTANVVMSNIWSVFNSEGKMLDRFAQIDTLFWDRYDESGSMKNYKIPEKQSALKIAGGVMGQNYSKRFLPSWVRVYRDMMVIDHPEFKSAVKLATKNQWTDASVIWMKHLASPKKRWAMAASYNMAIASEMEGNIDQSLKYLAQAAQLSSGAFSSAENEMIRKYAVVLAQRQNEIKKLSQQNENNR